MLQPTVDECYINVVQSWCTHRLRYMDIRTLPPLPADFWSQCYLHHLFYTTPAEAEDPKNSPSTAQGDNPNMKLFQHFFSFNNWPRSSHQRHCLFLPTNTIQKAVNCQDDLLYQKHLVDQKYQTHPWQSHPNVSFLPNMNRTAHSFV